MMVGKLRVILGLENEKAFVEKTRDGGGNLIFRKRNGSRKDKEEETGGGR
jgi:hypothetical protein